MTEIHCAFCGGVVKNVAAIEHRPPRASAQLALTSPELCACERPIVYDDPPVIEPPADEAASAG